MKNLLSKIERRFGRYLHAKFETPVVVLESDDWGMARTPSAKELKKYGEPGPWAEETQESEEDLESLYEILEKNKDRFGRPACITANFIMANPDWNAIERDGFGNYHDLFIDETNSRSLLQKYREGISRKCFYPQYHGRFHFSPELWLEDLQRDVPGARALFKARCHGGLSLLKGEGWRYHSEYLNWKSGRTPAGRDLTLRMKEALIKFEELFGYPSLSTIPPQYIFTDETVSIFKEAGIRFIQGASYRLLRNPDGSQKSASHYLGQTHREGVVYLARPVKFDPRPDRPQNHVDAALRQIFYCFETGIPAVIDTHRINYTGKYRGEALAQLSRLLQEVSRHAPVFLNTAELGEAVSNGGKYTDVFEKKNRTLKLKNEKITRWARSIYSFRRNHAY